MPKPKASFNLLRLFSPVQLFFCLILFFLPWIGVSCSVPSSVVKMMPKDQIEAAKKDGVDLTKPIPISTQSGLQIALGTDSPSSESKKAMELSKQAGGKEAKGDGKKDELGSAPLLFLFPLALFVGMVVPFIPIPPLIRRLGAAAVCGGAFCIIILQVLIGFPLESEAKARNKEVADMMKGTGGMSGSPAVAGIPGEDEMPAPPPKKGRPNPKTDKKTDSKSESKTDSKDSEFFQVSWKIPLYLTLLLLMSAGATSFLDALGGGGAAKRYGKRNRRDEDDDDEEEDDRSRKKDNRASQDDEDEDDRPRKKKKSRNEDDEEDDRSAKKKKVRDEDDEEDDRPKKKKARDRDDDEEDERPAKKKKYDDDEEDRPVKKKAPAEPEFQMPAASPPPPQKPAAPAPAGGAANPFAFDEGEDEPKPKKKPRPRDDDDEDDRPRKKRRRDDDD